MLSTQLVQFLNIHGSSKHKEISFLVAINGAFLVGTLHTIRVKVMSCLLEFKDKHLRGLIVSSLKL